jgi:hypothetical protein
MCTRMVRSANVIRADIMIAALLDVVKIIEVVPDNSLSAR